MVLRLVRFVEARGLSCTELFDSARVHAVDLSAPGVRLGYDELDRLIEAAAARFGAAGLGLALAKTRIDTAHGAAGLLLLTAPTYREGLRRALAYQRLWGDGERFRLHDRGADCEITFRHPGRSAVARAVLAECALAEIVEGARALVARSSHRRSSTARRSPKSPRSSE